MKKLFLLSIVIALLFTACKEKEEKIEERIVNVSAIVATEECFGEQRTYVGTVEESESISLSFETGGNLKEVFVNVGDKVNAGQLLARLDKKTAENAYNAAKSTLNQAEDGYERAKQLYDNGSLPEIKWVEIQTKLAQAQAMEKISKQSLDNCDLYSPSAGVIGTRSGEPGMNVSPFIPIFKLMNISQLKVKTSVPENEVALIEIGRTAKVVVPAIGNDTYDVKVVEKSIDADMLSHSYAVRCLFVGNHEKLLPGMVCKVYIVQPEYTGLVIPSRAVQVMTEGIGVWKIQNGRAKRCLVKSSKYVANGVLVTEGIERGDTIVTEGYQKLFDNAKVNIKL